jgi:hypothetical protein
MALLDTTEVVAVVAQARLEVTLHLRRVEMAVLV